MNVHNRYQRSPVQQPQPKTFTNDHTANFHPTARLTGGVTQGEKEAATKRQQSISTNLWPVYALQPAAHHSPPRPATTMSGRLLAKGILPLSSTQRAATSLARQYHHVGRFPTGGLQRTGADAAIRATRQRMWFPGNAFHNAVIARNASFARFLPKLAAKFIRIPAMFGGLMIGGVAWVQYQAIRESLR